MPEREPQETTDPEDVREWADRHGLVPVRRTSAGADADELALAEEGAAESDGSITRLGWDEFASAFERRDATFRYPEAEAGDGPDGANDPEATETDRTEGGVAFEEGETARTEVTETRTVEQEVVTTATVESEVVDEEVVSEEVVDTELLDREVIDCSVDESGEYVEVDLRERKRFTTEVEKRDAVESRVVDADAEGRGGDDARTVDREVNTEGEDTLADVVDASAAARELDEDAGAYEETDVDVEAAVEAGETELDERTERRTVETEMVGQYRVRAEVTERERVDAEVIAEEITATELVAEDEKGDDEAPAATPDPDHDPTDETVWVDDSHEGDAVVADDGETVGRIAGVDGLTIYVDVDPGTAERLDSGTGPGEFTDGVATVRQDQVEEVRDDSVVVVDLEGDRDGGA